MTQQEFIDKWFGVPWGDRGRSLEAIDCWNLVVEYYKDVLGIELRDASQFDNIETGFIDEVRNWEEVEQSDAGLVFTCYDGDTPLHVGICINSREVLHCAGNPKLNGCVSIHKVRLLKKVFGRMTFHRLKNG